MIGNIRQGHNGLQKLNTNVFVFLCVAIEFSITTLTTSTFKNTKVPQSNTVLRLSLSVSNVFDDIVLFLLIEHY